MSGSKASMTSKIRRAALVTSNRNWKWHKAEQGWVQRALLCLWGRVVKPFHVRFWLQVERQRGKLVEEVLNTLLKWCTRLRKRRRRRRICTWNFRGDVLTLTSVFFFFLENTKNEMFDLKRETRFDGIGWTVDHNQTACKWLFHVCMKWLNLPKLTSLPLPLTCQLKLV